MARIPRFVFTPRWVALFGVAAIVAGVCIRLGIWQLHRLSETRASNAQVEAGLAAAPTPVAGLFPAGGSPPGASALDYRRIVATGMYRPADEVLLYGRALDEQPGHHILTPLVLPDGRALIVDRGWVPYRFGTPPIRQAAPPENEVTVTGFLVPAIASGDYVGQRGPDGRLISVTEPDVPTIAPDLPYPALPLVVQLQAQDPPQAGDLPRVLPPPELSEGPHLSYAIQWFTFATIALVGYALLVRREIHDRRRSREAATAG
jgi:surfeit locus 1 family protein